MTDATRKDLERFIKELETLDVDDLPGGDFQGKTLDVVQWGIYQRIVKLLEDLPDKWRPQEILCKQVEYWHQ